MGDHNGFSNTHDKISTSLLAQKEALFAEARLVEVCWEQAPFNQWEGVPCPMRRPSWGRGRF